MCEHPTPFGPCQQPSEGVCAFHARWAAQAGEPDAFYHRKVALGLVTPTLGFLSEEEVNQLMGGKYHGDGRRLDAWFIDDPIAPF
jgi:hypothetical protein